jgi:RNA polymerase-binding transcription factor DksA
MSVRHESWAVLMAGGWSKDGDVQAQIDASVEDAVKRIRDQMPQGESLEEREECGAAIPEARRKAVPGVRFCIVCQSTADQAQKRFSAYNRRGSKDSQLR